MSESNTSNGQSAKSDLAVMDASEYKQKRRLKRVLDAHDEVEDIATAAFGQFAQGNIAAEGKNIRILKAVQKYIREAHGLVLEYLEEVDEDSKRVDEYWNNDDLYLGRITQHSRDDIIFRGLRDVLYAQDTYIERWEEPITTRHGPNRTVTRSASATVPEEVSLNAYLLLNELLTKERDIVGINFSDDSLPTWSFLEVDGDEDIVDTAEIARERMERREQEGDDE